MSDTLSISVIICTRDRAESLRITLECLERAMRPEIRVEVIVVDNAGQDNTKEVVESFAKRMDFTYLYEPRQGKYVKSYPLNRALDHGCKGEIIAMLDDDISPEPNWIEAVVELTKRFPDVDLFSGRTYVIWPDGEIPGWANAPEIRGWILSSRDYRDGDSPLGAGQWFMSGHFWFRARVLATGRRFRDVGFPTADFQLDLVESGSSGMANPTAAVGHRIQRHILDKQAAVIQAGRVGAYFARLRTMPYRKSIKQSRLLADHPIAGRLFCLLNYLRWSILLRVAHLIPSLDRRFVRRLVATERSANYRELLRAAGLVEEYALTARWAALRFWRKA